MSMKTTGRAVLLLELIVGNGGRRVLNWTHDARVAQVAHHSWLRTLIMSYFLPHLPSGWHVDEAIKSEEDRVVVIRFGHDWDPQCMTMDETLYGVAEKVQNFAVIYLCDITQVPDFNKVSKPSSAFPIHRGV